MNFKKANSLKKAILYQKELEGHDDSNAIISSVNLEEINIQNNEASILNNCFIAVKNNILIKDHKITSGSKMLSNYVAPKNAFVVDELLKNGLIPLVTTNMDELAMGGNGRNSYFGNINNPSKPDHIVGGSSAGSAIMVAEGKVSLALGSDTGDSIIWPAGINGIVGYKPTWGLVSREGLLDFSPSWDQIGWFSNNIENAAALADILVKKDPNDLTNVEIEKQFFLEDINENKKFTIGYSEDLKPFMNKNTLEGYESLIKLLRDKGHNLVNIEFDYNLISAFPFVYKIVSSVEALSTNFNLSGFLFGNDESNLEDSFEERIVQNRTNNFLMEVKKRFALASHFLKDYTKYEKAKKLRFLIKQEVGKKFEKIDIFLLSTGLGDKPTIEEYENDNGLSVRTNYLGLANATGYPAMNVPFGKRSMWITAKPFEDKKLFQIGKQIEEMGNEL